MADTPRPSLDEAIRSPEVQQGEASGFWKFVERKGDVLYFEVFSWSRDSFLLQLTADHFQDEPMLGRFVDRNSLACVAEAWPSGNSKFGEWFKWQPNHLFICWPGDRGGIGRHADWKSQKHWNRTPNPLHQYLEFIRKCLTIRGNGYQPRKPPSRAA